MGKGKKRFLAALGAVCLMLAALGGVALAEETAYAPIPRTGDAPYAPVRSALSADGLRYDDGSLRVEIEQDVFQDTKIYWVAVSLTDASQLRTALAGPKGSQKQAQPAAIAKRANAVLAINGDFFSGHSSGVVYRQGELLRNVPAYTRDELIIDEKGDLHILAFPANTAKPVITEAIEAFQQEHEIWEAFCFGPGLVIDGEVQDFNYTEKVSCGYPTRAQRVVFCQTGELEYLFLVTEGPEQDQPGLTVPECLELIQARGGARQVYNLDGGNSAQIILCGEKINAREAKTREIADMIVFATLVPGED